MANEERTFQRGETVPVHAYVRDWSDPPQYQDPSEGVKITILDPSGTAKVTDAGMTKLDVGKYVYYYASQLSDTKGSYIPRCTAQDGSGGSARITIEVGSFDLE